MIESIEKLNLLNFDEIPENIFWNTEDEPELKIHKVHVYPAKFPSLIAKKAFKYIENLNITPQRVADIFCGCGTVAVEAKRKGYDFWGCDINPVAVLLAEVKTNNYCFDKVKKYYNIIIEEYQNFDGAENYFTDSNERLQHWYTESQYNNLYNLKLAIEHNVPKGKYLNLFYCIFSSILKSTSKWLTSSIKPQVDPQKSDHDVLEAFKKQSKVFLDAIKQEDYKKSRTNIKCENVLDAFHKNYVDLIITSPPYVTSYEYADLHQLSTLWLGYVDDYTELRKNSIGTKHKISSNETYELPPTAEKIAEYFVEGAQKRSILKYYSDMLKVSKKCNQLLKENGLCIFVIGDTEYKETKIENARCLAESLILNGFEIKEISKRRVENKFLPSHRDKNGKFSSNKTDRQIYSQEYIIIGRKRSGKA